MENGFPSSPADSSRSLESDSSHSGNGDISSATSPSSQHSFPSLRQGTDDEHSSSKEATSFLTDLDNYLPLGCLCFEDLTESHEDQNTGVWQDITQLTPLLAFEETLYSHLHKLASSGWIRILSAPSTANVHYLILRIYILPFDVGLRFIDRQSKRLYIALENLVSELDVSPDTWYRKLVHGTANKFDRWASGDEGSLFWMFNKLLSPAPSADMVKEKYSHEALEDLLDSQSVLPGLKTPLYPYQRRSAGTWTDG